MLLPTTEKTKRLSDLLLACLVFWCLALLSGRSISLIMTPPSNLLSCVSLFSLVVIVQSYPYFLLENADPKCMTVTAAHETTLLIQYDVPGTMIKMLHALPTFLCEYWCYLLQKDNCGFGQSPYGSHNIVLYCVPLRSQYS
jgi:hypothetical protein